MELDFQKLKFLDNYMMPHIALTTFKYRAKATALFKKHKAEITIDQAIILKVLSHIENLTQQELAEITYKDKSNLSRMVESLQEKKLLKASLDLKDNRAVKKLEITEKGRALINDLFKYAIKLHNSAIDGITPEELETVKRVMKKIRNNLDKNIEAEL